jgi:hypothetical protein
MPKIRATRLYPLFPSTEVNLTQPTSTSL